MEYKASMDKTAKVLTGSVTALFAAIITAQLFFIKDEGAVSIFTIAVLLLIYFVPFAYRPISYWFTADELIIHRTFSNIIVKRNEIKSIEKLDEQKLRGTIRTFGVGGFFGYFGRFRNSKLGDMMWYATKRTSGVMIRTIHNKSIVITPNELETFMALFNR